MNGGKMTSQKTKRNNGLITQDAFTTFQDATGSEWRVEVELKATSGRIGISSLSITSVDGKTALTRRILRDLSLEELFHDVMAMESKQLSKAKQKETSHKGRMHTEDELREVAKIYMAAFQAHRPVQKTVADMLGISVSTAAKRIMAARNHGYITALLDAE